MKIYDCFTFYNELDLLDLRLAELYNHVDHFVIVEATTTFQNNTNPLFLKDNWSRYSQYHDKIVHVVVDDMPMSADTWLMNVFSVMLSCVDWSMPTLTTWPLSAMWMNLFVPVLSTICDSQDVTSTVFVCHTLISNSTIC